MNNTTTLDIAAIVSDRFIAMEATGVDCSIYRDQWRSTSITVESCDMCFDRSCYE